MNLSIEQMTTAEKNRTMEDIWDDLYHHAADIPSPSWHQDVLSQWGESVSRGTETFTDWETAKKSVK